MGLGSFIVPSCSSSPLQESATFPQIGKSPFHSPPPPPPELNSDAISEILLRLPPDGPADLVRASAVCKPWLRTLSDPAFLRRYRAFHGTPRLLGFLHNPTDSDNRLAHFVPTTAFRPHAAGTAHRTCGVLDCRHGRVLLYDYDSTEFVIWDPVSGHERRIIDDLPSICTAVLCAAGAGCDHSTCSGGPVLLASMGVDGEGDEIGGVQDFAYGCFYSSETDKTCRQTELDLEGDEHREWNLSICPKVLVGSALYIVTGSGTLLRYEVLGGHGLSVIQLPAIANDAIVMTAGDGGLGVASFDYDDKLNLWSAEMGPNRDATWSRIMLIDLQKLLPTGIDMSAAWLSGFAEDTNVIFLSTEDDGIFTVDLKSQLARKVCETGNVVHVFPYVSFYTPAAFPRVTLQPPVETQ